MEEIIGYDVNEDLANPVIICADCGDDYFDDELFEVIHRGDKWRGKSCRCRDCGVDLLSLVEWRPGDANTDQDH